MVNNHHGIYEASISNLIFLVAANINYHYAYCKNILSCHFCSEFHAFKRILVYNMIMCYWYQFSYYSDSGIFIVAVSLSIFGFLLIVASLLRPGPVRRLPGAAHLVGALNQLAGAFLIVVWKLDSVEL